jgi:hypothetical protein
MLSRITLLFFLCNAVFATQTSHLSESQVLRVADKAVRSALHRDVSDFRHRAVKYEVQDAKWSVFYRSIKGLPSELYVRVSDSTRETEVIFGRGTALDKESKDYIDSAFSAIFSSWSARELLDRASPELRQTTPGANVDQTFSASRSLGKLSTYATEGQVIMATNLNKGTIISANYFVRAKFERGSAEIYITLIKHGQQWQILGFYIKPTLEAPTSRETI